MKQNYIKIYQDDCLGGGAVAAAEALAQVLLVHFPFPRLCHLYVDPPHATLLEAVKPPVIEGEEAAVLRLDDPQKRQACL